MTTAAITTESEPLPPELVWRRLARQLAAPGRARMRLWSPDTGKFSDTAKYSDRLPSRPAAVYLYSHRRTHTLWLDFDAKHHGPTAVADDVARASQWITECGGVVITDRSTSGGRHLICPLAIGTSASLDDINHLVRLLAARLPTLDITPNTNPDTGCMTPPGSPCREGGHRQLDGTLDAAVEAFTTRSDPGLLPRLLMLLGALNPSPRPHTTTPPPTPAPTEYTVGIADDQRISDPHVRHDPLPADVAAYATSGTINPARRTWQSNHEARQSVIVNAIARGHSLTTLREMTGPDGPWHHGLGAAYDRYNHRRDQALARDVAKAFDWLITNVLKSSPPRHKKKNSPGGHTGGPRGPKDLRDWLANATAWADQEFAGKRYRWTVHAVLQSVAFHAVVAGEQRSGTWLVGVGGRALSLSSGLLSEDAIWRVLADLRDSPGSPLVLARTHLGTEADVYALTTQNRVSRDPAHAERVRVEPVHDAWIVLGHHLRRIYELVAHHGLTTKADLYAAAAVPRATGDAMVIDLEVAGLLKRTGRGTVGRGPTDLDTIAHGHHLDQHRTARIHRHQAERAAWRTWLAEREHARHSAPHTGTDHAWAAPGLSAAIDEPTERAYAEFTMSTGPPTMDTIDLEREAITMIADLLGGRILAGAG